RFDIISSPGVGREAAMSVKIEARYRGDDTVELVHGPSGNSMTTDLPVDNGGRGRTFSPTDLLGASLASCILTIMAKAAAKDGLDLSGASISLEKEMQASPRRVGRFRGRLVFPPGLSPAQKEKLKACIRACPVSASLHPDVKVELSLE
ncbi:MAG: OsmC family protein, partial [Elusimicrobia bacterium]|nr:OsmC family protein [Elusimicrobiota bacterium]